ncbi:MAG: lysylphosphatidylglycerol synthase domain-containing protein [Rhizobiaceae bacterium]
MTWRDYFWAAVGLAAVAVAVWLLYHEVRGISLEDVKDSLGAIPVTGWLLAAAGAIVAYAALAIYDHMALQHIGKRVSWLFVSLCSFTTYALSHNIGGSVVSGAVIRYRAYGTQGLTGQEVGILVAFCFVTFVLAAALLMGIVFLFEPSVIDRFVDLPGMPVKLSKATGVLILLWIAIYIAGSLLHLRPFRIGGATLEYPRPALVAQQLLIGPVEIMAAAAIVFFALPDAGNPGYFVVLGVFVVAFSLATSTHAPGGLGVFEVAMLTGLSDMDTAGVLAALLVFRLYYYIAPLLIALVIVVVFERRQLADRLRLRRQAPRKPNDAGP